MVIEWGTVDRKCSGRSGEVKKVGSGYRSMSMVRYIPALPECTGVIVNRCDYVQSFRSGENTSGKFNYYSALLLFCTSGTLFSFLCSGFLAMICRIHENRFCFKRTLARRLFYISAIATKPVMIITEKTTKLKKLSLAPS